MGYRILELNVEERAHQKQASRDRDLARLRNGEISPAELAQENNFFAALDLPSFKIVSIGGRPATLVALHASLFSFLKK